MDPQLLIFGGAGIALLIGGLVLRESTEVRLTRMRTALMSLRNQVLGLEQKINDMQTTKSQINEAMSRAQGRQSSIGHLLESVYDDLEKLYQHLREEKLPGPPGLETDEEDDSDE
jgi:CII-binding regulator of phage lambda lysogenization HflD